MRKIATAGLAMALSALPLLLARSGSCAYRVPGETELAQLLDRAVAGGHPRLIFDDADFARMRRRAESGDEWFKSVAAAVCRHADAAVRLPPIANEPTGFRLLHQSRRAVDRICTLAMAYRLTGKSAYLRAAADNLRTVAGFPSWNPRHFLDVGEMALAVAVGYDWLHAELDGDLRRQLEKAIAANAFLPAKKNFGGGENWLWWVNADNNWPQVCHGGLIAAAIAFADAAKPDSVFLIRRAVENLPASMRVYAPNGGYPEGPAYWCYGTSFTVLALAALEKAFGDDFGLSTLPGFAETAAFQDLCTGNSGQFFNFADGRSVRAHDVSVWWMARRFGREDLLAENAVALLDRELAEYSGSEENRLFAFTLGFMPDSKPARSGSAMPHLWTAAAKEDVGVQRSSGKSGAQWFAAFKAGSPSQNHAHMDSGSFVLDRFGRRWIHDLGAEHYHRIESRGIALWDRSQDSGRWKVYRISNASHNLPVIDGEPMLVSGRGKIVRSEDFGGGASVLEIDGSSLHKSAAKVLRRSEMLPGDRGLRITDSIVGARPGAVVRWQLMVEKGAKAENNRLLLRHGGRSVSAIADADAQWRLETNLRPNEWDSPNDRYVQAWFAKTVPADGAVEIAVSFE